MNVRPFIVDEEIRLKISDLVKHAEENIITLDEIKALLRREAPPAGDMSGYSVNIPFGYRVVYSIEELPGGGRARHLSMSVEEYGKIPNHFTVREMISLVGFKDKLEDCKVWLEDLAPGYQAVNVLEVIG